MPPETQPLRTRRALLTAAAGTAAALAASAALPLTAAAADPDDVVKGVDNATTQTTSITDSGAGSTAVQGNATGTGAGYGVEGTSLGAGGVVGWSVSSPQASYWPDFDPAFTQYTGVFGSSPTYPDPNILATGVWGDSPDIGVYGTGLFGVYGFGAIAVQGVANSQSGSIGVRAIATNNSQKALVVTGKVSLSRSGRKTMGSGTSSTTISLAGVTTTSKVFAVLSTNEKGRWVRAVVPGTNSFVIRLNTALASSAVVSWFVLD
jgi:hypothetical protein